MSILSVLSSIAGPIIGGLTGSSASNRAGRVMEDAGRAASQGVSQAASNAQDAVNRATPQANALLQAVYEAIQGNLKPYQTAGEQGINALAAGLADGGELSTPFQFEADPGYQFRLEQGNKALERTQAARGGLLSGRGVKEAQRFNSGLASQEYQGAFDRFQNTRQQRYNMLTGLAGFGQDANSQAMQAGSAFVAPQAQNIIEGQKYAGDVGLRGALGAGDFWMQGAGGRASGYTNGAKAWSEAIPSATNALTDALDQWKRQNQNSNVI